MYATTQDQADAQIKFSARCGVTIGKEYIGEIFMNSYRNPDVKIGKSELVASGKRVSISPSAKEGVISVFIGRLPTENEISIDPTVIGYDTVIVEGSVTEKRFILHYQTKSESIYCHRIDVSAR